MIRKINSIVRRKRYDLKQKKIFCDGLKLIEIKGIGLIFLSLRNLEKEAGDVL